MDEPGAVEGPSWLREAVVVSSGSVRMVRGEGMPQYRNPFDKGDLYVKFDVQFPQNNWISPEKLVVGLVAHIVQFAMCASSSW